MTSHFQFSNKQRNGIFLLLLIIICLQGIILRVDFSEEETISNSEELNAFKSELDSLRLVKIENTKPKIYPFNPNYITDYKGYVLGLSNEEIDRLLKFRSGNKWINSAKAFQEVTKISDSLLAVISPYFKFPDWVKTPKPKSNLYNRLYSNNNNTPKTYTQKRDLNTATANQLQKIYGIGDKLSKRIISYRNQFAGGFVADIELSEVYGLSAEVIERITHHYTVKTPRQIRRYNLNMATRDELVLIKYIDYEIANTIIEERTLREGFKTLEALLKVDNFPIHKIEIIKLYLYL